MTSMHNFKEDVWLSNNQYIPLDQQPGDYALRVRNQSKTGVQIWNQINEIDYTQFKNNEKFNKESEDYTKQSNQIEVSKGLEKAIVVKGNFVKILNRNLSRAIAAIDVWRLGAALSDDIYFCEHAKEIIHELERTIREFREELAVEKDIERRKELEEKVDYLMQKLREVKRTRKAPIRTIKTTASVAGGWGAGIAGGSAGAWIGAQAGIAIGTIFGPMGIMIGAPVGAVCGALSAGISSGIAGSKGAEIAAEKGLQLLD